MPNTVLADLVLDEDDGLRVAPIGAKAATRALLKRQRGR